MKTPPAKFSAHPREPKHAPNHVNDANKTLKLLVRTHISLHPPIRTQTDISLSNYAQFRSVPRKLTLLFFIYEQ